MKHKVPISMRARNRRAFEAGRITRNSGETLIPQPAQCLLGGLEPDEIRRVALANDGLVGGGEGFVSLGETGADKQDVAGAEGDVFFLDDLLQGVEGDGDGC